MTKRTRRDFLRTGGAGAVTVGLIACSAPSAVPTESAPPTMVVPTEGPPELAVPTEPICGPTMAPVGPQAATVSPDQRSLVVIQLGGGDDGLNMVVPYGDGLYYQLRPQVAIPADHVLPLDGRLGLHPNLKAFKRLYDRGQMAFIQGVGYPNPSRSHFRSMDIWHTARTDANAEQGWLGAFMAEVYRVGESPFQCVNLGNSIPKALQSEHAPTAAFQDSSTFSFLADRNRAYSRDPLLKTFGQMYGKPSRKLPALELVANTWDTTARGVDALHGASEKYQPTASYPTSPFAKALQEVAKLIAAGLGTRVFYVSQGGFDTHSNQKPAHANLMTTVSDGLGAFLNDLEQMGRSNQVLVLGFSEFGRRVRENGSGGTDHGAAGPMFAIGPGVKGGVYGDHPSLADLDDGDLRMTVDFRSVYATILDTWFGVESKAILGGSYDRLGFVA